MGSNVFVTRSQGASVFPSDEDSQTFSINANNGDSYRLKGLFLGEIAFPMFTDFCFCISSFVYLAFSWAMSVCQS
jgi:hypothetical protein